MDELKLKIDIREAIRAADRLQKAIEDYDHRQIGAQLYILRQRLQFAALELGIKPFDVADLKPEPPQE